MGIPTVSVITERFIDLFNYAAELEGIPLLRHAIVPHPIAGLPHDLIRNRIEQEDSKTGIPFVRQVINALTSPLSAEEGGDTDILRMVPRTLEQDTPESLISLFHQNGWTDGQPFILPTVERVSAMLKGTSRSPHELVGRMAPSAAHEKWSYTVEQVAVNAVMAGCKPEHLPVLLAIASLEEISTPSSTANIASMVVVNGPIREEIGMNWGIGAMGPHNHTNAVIGRAFQLLSRNLAGGLEPESTYLGTYGSSLSYNNVIIAENEEDSVWEPFHVTKGFAPEESVVSLLAGFGGGWNAGGRDMAVDWESPIIKVASARPNIFTQMVWIMDPLRAEELAVFGGFDTKEKVGDWFYENVRLTAGEYWADRSIRLFKTGPARAGTEPYATWLELPPDAMIPKVASPEHLHVVVVGGKTNNFSELYDWEYKKSTSVDEWR